MTRIRFVVLGILWLMPGFCLGRTWYIEPDGTGDAQTIQAGVDSAWSDGFGCVVVAPGTYHEHGIHMRSGVILEGDTGDPGDVTVDADGIGTVIYCDSLEARTVISGFTLTGGLATGPGARGGGMNIRCGSPTISECVFLDNTAEVGGGIYVKGGAARFVGCLFSANAAGNGAAAYCESCSVVMSNCTFTGNEARFHGTVLCSGGSPHFARCTLHGNLALAGGGVYVVETSSVELSRTIIAYSMGGGAVTCAGPGDIPSLTCRDIFGNTSGDWEGCIEDQYAQDGNFSACPSFCHAHAGDFHLCQDSPCLPGNHPEGYVCGLVGAWGQGCTCGPSRAGVTTWGGIKSLYR
jgi:hypothetical protein